MIRNAALLAALALALSGCGGRVVLQPKDGQAIPMKPEGAEKTPTAEDLMKPSPQAKPQRSDEQLKRSEQRREDEFDLPPSA